MQNTKVRRLVEILAELELLGYRQFAMYTVRAWIIARCTPPPCRDALPGHHDYSLS